MESSRLVSYILHLYTDSAFLRFYAIVPNLILDLRATDLEDPMTDENRSIIQPETGEIGTVYQLKAVSKYSALHDGSVQRRSITIPLQYRRSVGLDGVYRIAGGLCYDLGIPLLFNTLSGQVKEPPLAFLLAPV